MTEIKTRPMRPFECYSLAANDFSLYIANGDRILEKGDRPVFAGHNGAHIELQVVDCCGVMRWVYVDSSLVYINA